MTFDKDKYWARRNNTVKEKVPDGDKKKKDGTPRMKTVETPKPLRGQGDKPKPVVLPNTDSDVEMGFDSNGKLIAKTRAWKRRHVKLRTKTGRIPERKLADHKKKQAARKRKEARELKKEKANG